MTNRIPFRLSFVENLLLAAARILAASGALVIAATAFGLVGRAKAQSEAPPAFEVASVRQHPISEGFIRRAESGPTIQCPPWHCGISGNTFTEDVASLTDLIMDAYSVKRFQIAGLPTWGDSGQDVYDIAAKIEGDRTATLDRVRRMLQTLLADRFQLRLHHEARELPVYALVVAKNGPKLTPVPQEEGKPLAVTCPETPSGVRIQSGGGGRDANNGGGRGGRGDPGSAMAVLRLWERVPEVLSMFADRPVIDRTGLKESVYCTFDGQDPLFAMIGQLGGGARGGQRGAIPDVGSDAPSLFTVIQEKWGMKLEPQKAPVDLLVIDHVERPTAN